MNPEAQIAADIEAIKASDHDTQDMYREVCALLFFRYGITPTANKLYQYVRKGSMSAPAEALGRFWEDLREKSRVRIEHPDLPDNLKNLAGDLVAHLWSQSMTEAQQNLEVFRTESQESVIQAQQALHVTEQERQVALDQAKASDLARLKVEERALQLERNLAAETATRVQLEQQLHTMANQQRVLEAALAEARKDFTTELENSRAELRRAEERLAASEKRALLEIDRERQSALRWQRELEQMRQHSLEKDEQNRKELIAARQELANVTQQLGAAEGKILEMRSVNDRLHADLSTSRQICTEQSTQIAVLSHDLGLSKDTVKDLQLKLEKILAARRPKRAARSHGEESS